MAGRFDGISDLAKTINKIKNSEPPVLKAPLIDKRSRLERREDFDKELEGLDKQSLLELKERVNGIVGEKGKIEGDIYELRQDIGNFLTKFIRYVDKFEDLNSEESRKLELKKKELALESRHDWFEKLRLFFFRVLASALLIVTLFTIGYLEKEYEWATLPLSKYVKTIP